MSLNIYVTYTDKKQIEKLGGIESPSFHFIDMTTVKGQKEGFTLKSHWAAKKDPFGIVFANDKPIKAFYSEAENVVQSILNYIKDE